MTDYCGEFDGFGLDLDSGPSAAAVPRPDVLRRAAVAGTIVVAGAALAGRRPQAAAAAPSRALDRRIFKFALLLEYLQASFYTEAVATGALRGEVRAFAEVVSRHEREHVAYLKKALGRHAGAKPKFVFGAATRKE